MVVFFVFTFAELPFNEAPFTTCCNKAFMDKC